MRRAAKKDATHDERVAEMKAYGLDVIDTSWSAGKLLDCVVQHPGTMRAMFVEIKNDDRGKLTPKEYEFRCKRPHACFVVSCYADVVRLWELLRR